MNVILQGIRRAAVVRDPQLARAALDESRARLATIVSPLPERPDEAAVEGWLRKVRTQYLTEC